MEIFELEGHDFIELCDLLKTTGFCESGGRAKTVISEGQVKVDGNIELRKRCKIRKDQVVEFNGQSVRIK